MNEEPIQIGKSNINQVVFDIFFPGSTNGQCLCCGEKITLRNYQNGHIISKANNGEDDIYNRIPLCSACNGSGGMGRIDYFSYKSKYFSKIEVRIPENVKRDLIIYENKILRNENNILKEKLKSISFKNNNITIKKDESNNQEKLKESQKPIIEDNSIKYESEESKISKSYTKPKHPGKANNPIIGFTYKGKEIKTHTIKDALKFICDDLVTTHKDFSEKVKTKKYFSEDPDRLSLNPYKVKNTNLYMKTNLNAKDTEIHIREILSLFGHSQDIFKFNYME